MKRTEHKIEFPERLRIHVTFAAWVEIHFGRFQNMAARFPIHSIDLSCLLAQGALIDPPGDLQPFRMIGDGDVFVTSLASRLRHFQNRPAAVTPLAVHLQVATQSCRPARIAGEDAARLCKRQEIAPDIWGANDARLFHPALDSLFQKWSNAAKRGEGFAVSENFAGFARPQKCRPRRATISALRITRCALGFASKKLGNIAISHG